MFSGDFVECNKNTWVGTLASVHEGAMDGLYLKGAGLVERGGGGCLCSSTMWLARAVAGLIQSVALCGLREPSLV